MNEKESGLIFLLISPSGSGKTAILNRILVEFPDIHRYITYTTRDPRQGEVNGRDYFFVTKDQFQLMIKEDKLVEWEEFFGHLYGSSKTNLDKFLTNNQDGIAAYDVRGQKTFTIYIRIILSQSSSNHHQLKSFVKD